MEINWNIVSAIGTCLGAFATFCACLIALWQTKKTYKKEIKIYFNEQITFYHPTIPKNESDFVGITIINSGNRPVTITEWAYELENNKKSIIILNYANPLLTKLPITINPEQKAELYYEKNFFEKNLKSFVKEDHLKLKKKIKFSITDTTNQKYYFRSHKRIKDYLQKRKMN